MKSNSCLIVATLALLPLACSGNIVRNGTFEATSLSENVWAYSATDWNTGGDAGTWNPNTVAYNPDAFEGNHVAFVQSGWTMPDGVLSQNIKLYDSTTYSMSFLYASRLDNPLGLGALDVELGTDWSWALSSATRGEWQAFNATFTTSGTNPLLYREYQLTFATALGQYNLDDLSIFEVVPTGGTTTLMGMGTLLISRHRRRGTLWQYHK